MNAVFEDASQAISDVVAIADGLSATRCRQRGAQAFQWANDCRARYPSVMDTSRRTRATAAAQRWALILDYLDDTGEEQLSAGSLLEWLHEPWWRRALGWLNLRTWIQGARLAFGTEPVTWYCPPDPDEDDIVVRRRLLALASDPDAPEGNQLAIGAVLAILRDDERRRGTA